MDKDYTKNKDTNVQTGLVALPDYFFKNSDCSAQFWNELIGFSSSAKELPEQLVETLEVMSRAGVNVFYKHVEMETLISDPSCKTYSNWLQSEASGRFPVQKGSYKYDTLRQCAIALQFEDVTFKRYVENWIAKQVDETTAMTVSKSILALPDSFLKEPDNYLAIWRSLKEFSSSRRKLPDQIMESLNLMVHMDINTIYLPPKLVGNISFKQLLRTDKSGLKPYIMLNKYDALRTIALCLQYDRPTFYDFAYEWIARERASV